MNAKNERRWRQKIDEYNSFSLKPRQTTQGKYMCIDRCPSGSRRHDEQAVG